MGALNKHRLIFLKAVSHSGDHKKALLFGEINDEKFGIYLLYQESVPTICLTCFTLDGVGKVTTTFTLLGSIYQITYIFKRICTKLTFFLYMGLNLQFNRFFPRLVNIVQKFLSQQLYHLNILKYVSLPLPMTLSIRRCQVAGLLDNRKGKT